MICLQFEFVDKTVYAHAQCVLGGSNVSFKTPIQNAGNSAEEMWSKRLVFEAEMAAFLKKANYPDVYWEGIFWRTVRLGLQGLGLYRRGMRNADDPVLTQTTFACPALPAAFDGLQILFLSDFHFSERHDHNTALERILTGITPDLVALGGDYEYRMFSPETWVTEGIRRLQTYLTPPLGFVAVMGNNDRSTIVPILEKHGVRVLVNRALSLERGKDQIWIAGVDDPHDFQTHSVELALQTVPANAFSILLAHSPEILAEAALHHVAIYLCGHTHGGQIRIPKIGPV